QLTRESNDFHGQTSKRYNNMVGPFGGVTAATLLRSVLEHPERQGIPVSLTINYAAPVSDGASLFKQNQQERIAPPSTGLSSSIKGIKLLLQELPFSHIGVKRGPLQKQSFQKYHQQMK